MTVIDQLFSFAEGVWFHGLNHANEMGPNSPDFPHPFASYSRFVLSSIDQSLHEKPNECAVFLIS